MSYIIEEIKSATISSRDMTTITLSVLSVLDTTVEGRLITTTSDGVEVSYYVDSSEAIKIHGAVKTADTISGIPVTQNRFAWFETIQSAVAEAIV